MPGGLIAMLGGGGFVGRAVANRLYAAGYRARVLTRDREARRRDLLPIPTVELIQADAHDPPRLERALAGCDAVINLVGILNERDADDFARVHVGLSEKVIAACRKNGIRRLLHISALNADADTGASRYLKSKGEAENLVHAAVDLEVTSFRPSVIFGPGDRFFNRFATLLRFSPGVFPLACAAARFAPVYVGDVAAAITRAVEDPRSHGRRYALRGPEEYSLLELVRLTARLCGLKRWIIPLPDFASRLQGRVFDLLGFVFHACNIEQPFSTDNYLSTRQPSVAARNDLPALGIAPTHLRGVVAQYLGAATSRAQYRRFRREAGRGGGRESS